MVFKENKFQKDDQKTRCDVASGFLYLREWKFFSIKNIVFVNLLNGCDFYKIYSVNFGFMIL